MDGLPEKRLIEGREAAARLTSARYSLVAPAPATIKTTIRCVGIGLHTGQRIRLQISPAPAGTGIVFHRTDLGVHIPARFDHVSDTRLCTVVAKDGARVATVEHLLAALAGLGIDNAVVALDGPEVPILDGSAEGFVFLLECAGREELSGPRDIIEILRPIRVEDGASFMELRPSFRTGLDISLSIAFDAPAIGRQALSLAIRPDTFRSELMRARTFTHAADVTALQQAGLALGGSLANAIVVNGDSIENPEGLRMPDEFVRHKMLDIVGDLALAGAPIYGRVVGNRSGHTLNNRLLHHLFANPTAWRMVSVEPNQDWLSAA